MDKQAQIARYTEEARGHMVDVKARLDKHMGYLQGAVAECYHARILEESRTVHNLAKDYKQACERYHRWLCQPETCLRKELALLR